MFHWKLCLIYVLKELSMKMKWGAVRVQEVEELSDLEKCILVVSFVRLLEIVLMMLLIFMDSDSS